MQVNAVSDAKVDSYIAILNKGVSISYAKRLNASLFNTNKSKSSCANEAALQRHQRLQTLRQENKLRREK
jgi:hypothetical protein